MNYYAIQVFPLKSKQKKEDVSFRLCPVLQFLPPDGCRLGFARALVDVTMDGEHITHERAVIAVVELFKEGYGSQWKCYHHGPFVSDSMRAEIGKFASELRAKEKERRKDARAKREQH